MRYDFDMVAVTPRGLPAQFGDLETTGVGTEKIAMFCDPEVVAALGRADEAVRTFFTDSGFAMQAHDNGAPSGRFPMHDEDARVAVIQRLSQNLATHNLEGANWGGFEFAAFMQALSVAEPIEEELLAPTSFSPRLDPEIVAAQIASRRKKGQRRIAMGGLALGLVLLLYAASQMLVG